MNILIRSLDQAHKEVWKYANIMGIVSIGRPGAEVPDGLDPDHPRHLRLEFDDVWDDPAHNFSHYTRPTEDDVHTIIDAFDAMSKAPSGIYTHCFAGISRSSAVAFIYHVMHCDDDDLAIKKVHTVRVQARPNPLIVEMADAILGRGGKMMDALDKGVRVL